LIDSFYLTGTGLTDEDDSEVYRKCGSDYVLNGQTIKFPDSTSAPATFVLKIRDHAGHPSVPYAFEIPACGNDALAFVHCWRP
jgi:hypothetical protein